MSGVLPIYNKNFVLTRDSSCFFKMLSQLREVWHHSRRTVWMMLRFRRLDTDSPLFPIDVLPSQRQSFAWCSKPYIACQRDYRLPSNIAEWLLVLHPCGRENSHPKMPVTYEPACLESKPDRQRQVYCVAHLEELRTKLQLRGPRFGRIDRLLTSVQCGEPTPRIFAERHCRAGSPFASRLRSETEFFDLQLGRC